MTIHLRKLIPFLALLLAAVAQAHPYHTSFAEIDWNEAGDALEVSLRVLPEDLETALTWRAGKAVVLAQNAEVQAQVAAYLQEHFQVLAEDSASGAGTPLPLRLAGMEVAYNETWLYFTVAARPEMRLRLRNTVLMDVDSTQTNRVQPLWGLPDNALVLTSAQPEIGLWQGR
jgi:Domain of unknown function (DUF6702)